MTKIANNNIFRGNNVFYNSLRPVQSRQQMTEVFSTTSSVDELPGQMVAQSSYGLSPLSDEEVRRLPAAHQFSL